MLVMLKGVVWQSVTLGRDRAHFNDRVIGALVRGGKCSVGFQQASQSVTENGVIVGNHNAYGWRRRRSVDPALCDPSLCDPSLAYPSLAYP